MISEGVVKQKNLVRSIITTLVLFKALVCFEISDEYMILNARADDPLFTTYAAAKERSRLYGDKAYFMNYFSEDEPITFTSQYAGDWFICWKINNVVIDEIWKYYEKPVIVASFPDMAVLKFSPFEGIDVEATFFVFSSSVALIDMVIKNTSEEKVNLFLYSTVHLPDDSVYVMKFDDRKGFYYFSHYESLVRLHSNLYDKYPYPTSYVNILTSYPQPTSFGTGKGASKKDFYFVIKRLSKVHQWVVKLNERRMGYAEFVSVQDEFVLKPGAVKRVRLLRGSQDINEDFTLLEKEIERASVLNIQKFVDKNVRLFRSIPRIRFKSRDEKLVYISSFNLVRQCMLPASGKTSYNFYVFSRNPIWGWGHGHQVMHESISMMAYAYLDPESAQGSQRVYMEQQYPDGLIGYRHGPRGPQVYPYKGIATTSAPFFSWTNWEIYEVSRDMVFLKDAYEAGKRYIEYLYRMRDKDKDGMFEWGPYGIIENVRDGWNVVFQLFSEGEDEGRDISDELDALDLTCQVANEVYHLYLMAKELGYRADANVWLDRHRKIAELVNRYMWDEKEGFYFHVNMKDNSFVFEGKSLKRKEIIGFLPMWARIATKERARRLVKHLLNEDEFWRKYGVPTLSADDPNYTPYVDGCCRWNGPVWLLWDYMVFEGLRNYGYKKIANKLADKMLLAVVTQLKENHRFWESYSPDFPVQESPSNYIWDSIMAKVLIEKYLR